MNAKVKKLLPIIIGLFMAVAVIAFFLIRGSNKNSDSSDEEGSKIPTLSESEWPAVSLTPTEKSDVAGSLGHWLDFKVEKINVSGAASMDYLLIYDTSDGGQQGVPGTVDIEGTTIERKLLLGSESSGKYRYDDGVEVGTMTITFRDSKGKSLGKLITAFHLQSETSELTSVDGSFTYNLDETPKGVYFVTMKTFMEPSVPTVAWQNGYGVFASDGEAYDGTVASE